MIKKRVIVKSGRNKGDIGIVIAQAGSSDNYLVDFGRNILVNEGFGSFNEYPDQYWLQRRHLEELFVED